AAALDRHAAARRHLLVPRSIGGRAEQGVEAAVRLEGVEPAREPREPAPLRQVGRVERAPPGGVAPAGHARSHLAHDARGAAPFVPSDRAAAEIPYGVTGPRPPVDARRATRRPT